MSRPTKGSQIDENVIETSSMSQKKSADEFNINDFPEEIIIGIFSHLTLSERKKARLVCQRWHRISYSFRLIRNDVTVLHENFNLMKTPSSSSQHINIRLILNHENTKHFSIMCNSRNFWQNHCQNMRSLDITISNCNIFMLLSKILYFCPHIEQIHLFVVWQRFFHHRLPKLFSERVQLRNLRSLRLNGYSDFIFPMLKVALMTAPKLVCISVSCDNLPHTLEEGPPLLNLDFRPASNLEEIYLSGDIINYRFLADIKGIFSNKLKRLTLHVCPQNRVSLTDLEGIAGTCLNLKQLELQGIHCDEPPNHLPFLSNNSLTSIIFGPYMNLTDDMVASLSVLKNLANFDLFFTSNLTHTGIEKIFGKRVRPEMEELRMDNMSESSDFYDVIVRILPNLPNLKILYLSKLKITKQLLETLMTHNTSLEGLTLKGKYDESPPYALLSNNILTKLMYLDIYGTTIPRIIVENLELPSLKFLFCKLENCQPRKVSSSIRVGCYTCWISEEYFNNFYVKNNKQCRTCYKYSFVYCCKPLF